jgi:hypothetical protein
MIFAPAYELGKQKMNAIQNTASVHNRMMNTKEYSAIDHDDANCQQRDESLRPQKMDAEVLHPL